MAKIQTNLLTDIQIRKWIRAGSPVAKSDGGGLTFTLSAVGAATWVLRFTHGGRRQEVTLGRYPDMTLSAARLSASKKRLAVVDGTNPADEVRKVKTRRDWTMRELIRDYRTLVLCEMGVDVRIAAEQGLRVSGSGADRSGAPNLVGDVGVMIVTPR